MNYDSWKLISDTDPRQELLADRCTDAEAHLQRKLVEAIQQANLVLEGRWECEEVLAEADATGTIRAELSLRLTQLPVRGSVVDLQELATSLAALSDCLSRLAQSNQSVRAVRMSPSVSGSTAGRIAELG
jgi:hypothetical protein